MDWEEWFRVKMVANCFCVAYTLPRVLPRVGGIEGDDNDNEEEDEDAID